MMTEIMQKRKGNLIMVKRKKIFAAALLAMFLLGLADISYSEWTMGGMRETPEETQAAAEMIAPKTSLYAGVLAEFCTNEMATLEEHKDVLVAAANYAAFPEAYTYTFLQGPKSWEEQRAWSGEWSNEYVKGNYFGNFGCGLCCMANIYCSMTEYTCSPWDMYEHARQVSGYSPTGKTGAIGWADMKVTLRKSGFDCSLNQKAESYEAFQEQIRQAKSAVVLVCSQNDDTFWENTGGHYVNISGYNVQTDEVFLADPGSPDRNRSRIPLRYVYDALKTASQYQYLLVYAYSEDANQWKQNGIDESWVRP